ncbi:MAG TPA: hypothetical protein VJP02_29750 [Candidatus Sulfotelmatobacter sp.]|nr:hypothetical protein [Candidatus Sulfotelmatobacter sp.]
MSFKAVAWTLLAAMAFAAVVLFNFWAAYQPLSTLAYSGFVLALSGMATWRFRFDFLESENEPSGLLSLRLV